MARRRCQARRRGAGPVTYRARPMVANSRNRPGGQCCKQAISCQPYSHPYFIIFFTFNTSCVQFDSSSGSQRM